MKCTGQGKQLKTVVVLQVYAVASHHSGLLASTLAHRMYCPLIGILPMAHQDCGWLVATCSLIMLRLWLTLSLIMLRLWLKESSKRNQMKLTVSNKHIAMFTFHSTTCNNGNTTFFTNNTHYVDSAEAARKNFKRKKQTHVWSTITDNAQSHIFIYFLLLSWFIFHGHQHMNLHQSVASMSRVTCYILLADTRNGLPLLKLRQLKSKGRPVWIKWRYVEIRTRKKT